jgi:hypothetical protein
MSMKLTISVSDIDTVIQSFDTVRIRRSIDGIDGAYNLITANTPQAAVLVAPAVGNYDVAGKTLNLSIDFQTPVLVTFTGTAPLDADAVATQINGALSASVAIDDGNNALKLLSEVTGTASAVRVIDGTSIGDFGWTPDTLDGGEDAHIALIAGQSLYTYVDNAGSAEYYYTAQYYNMSNNLSSTESAPFKGDPGTVVGDTNLSLALIDLADGRGIALPDQPISFWSINELIEVDAFTLGIQRGPIATVVTDAAGHAEVMLVRGLEVKVVFEGTSIIREFTVPDEDNFNLVDKLGDSPDRFNLKEPDFHLTLRRTL